jgi:hypothetical protein
MSKFLFSSVFSVMKRRKSSQPDDTDVTLDPVDDVSALIASVSSRRSPEIVSAWDVDARRKEKLTETED